MSNIFLAYTNILYFFRNDFRSIYSVNENLTEALIEWKNNWVTFIDGILQLNILRRKHNTVSKANFIRELSIDVNKQVISKTVSRNNDISLFRAHVNGHGSTVYVLT